LLDTSVYVMVHLYSVVRDTLPLKAFDESSKGVAFALALLGFAIVACSLLYWIWFWRLQRYYEDVARAYLIRANAEGKLGATHLRRQSLRLLSYNVFVRPPGISARGNDFKDERLARLLAQLVRLDVDVVALQELFRFGSPRQRAFVWAACRLGGYRYSAALPYPPRGWHWPPRILDGGVTVLSRLPVERVAFTTYRSAHWHYIDCLVAKGVLCVHLRMPFHEPSTGAVHPGKVALFATHAQAGNASYPGIRVIRRKQLQQLARFVQEEEAGEGILPAIICGDLNLNGMDGDLADRDSSEYTEMMSILNGDADASAKPVRVFRFRDLVKEANDHRHPVTVDAVTAEGTPREPLLIPAKARKQPKRLDYILCDPGPRVSCRVLAARVEPFILDSWDTAPFRQLSDHDAIFVEMEFTES